MTGHRPYSAITRLRRFSDDNPDEWLTLQDVAIKFAVSNDYAREMVRAIRDTDGIEVARVFRKVRPMVTPA